MQMGLNQFSSLVEWNSSIWIPITEHSKRPARIQSAGQGASAEKEGDINKIFEGCPFPFKAIWIQLDGNSKVFVKRVNAGASNFKMVNTG
jgi:hypothetical protein